MFCLNCGKPLKDGATFCGECGQRVQQPASPAQETIIIPEVPAEQSAVMPETPAEPKQPAVNQPTIIVPEIPETPVEPEEDPLEQMYSDKTESKSNIGLIIGLVAAAILLISVVVVVILGAMNNWWRTETHQDDKPDEGGQTTVTTTAPATPTPDGEQTPDELRDSLKEYYGGGLYFYLGEEFAERDRDDNGLYYKAKDVKLYVRWGSLKDVDSSEEYAKQYKKELNGEFISLSSFEKNDITYMIIDVEDDEVIVVGFYVQDGYGWVIEAYTDEFDELGEDLINYVTLGVIDEEFEAPEFPGADAERQEMGFAGLYLNLDSTFEVTAFEEYAFLTAEGMDICIQLNSLSALGVDSSEAYAEYYMELKKTMDWSTLEIQTLDEEFYYVLMIGEDGLVNIVGLYSSDDTAWVVTGETRDRENAVQILTEYVTSGRIEPSEIPDLEEVSGVTLNGLTLPLENGYRETYRGEYVILTNGKREIYIFTGKLADLEGTITSVEELVNKEYQEKLNLWDNVQRYTANGVQCMMTWDNDGDSVATAYAYYVAEGYWWTVQISQIGQPENELLNLISKGTVDPSAVGDNGFQRGEVVQRKRINLKGQSTAEYYGLRISYSPDWTVNPDFGPTGDYTGEKFEMMSNQSTRQETGTDDALEYAWRLAEQYSQFWGSYEVGKAGGVPYVLLRNDGSNDFRVIGTYANSEYCWEIDVTCSDPELVEEAIWYATAGVIL